MRSSMTYHLAAAAFAVVGTVGMAQGPAASAGALTLKVAGRTNATPSVAADAAWVAVAWGATLADGKADVFVAVSRDGAETFAAPVQVNAQIGEARLGGEMPPRVALYRAAPTMDPEIVVLWTARGATTSIKVARSRDGGRSFSTPVVLQTDGAAGDRGWPALAIDQRGVAHAAWLDHRGLAKQKDADSTHKGHTTAGATEHDGVAMAQRSGLFYSTAGPAGTERMLTTGVCYCCKTAMAVGPDDTVFAAWRHVYPGNLRDIAFTMSRDGGRTFTPPARVSEDNWAINGCPDDGPAMTVDTTGTVHLVWPSVIAGPEPTGALFYASSHDGRTFTPRLRIPTIGGPKPSHPQIARGSNGDLVIAWDEAVNGQRVAAMRSFSVAGPKPQFGDIVILAASTPATHPVLAPTNTGLVAVWSQRQGQDSSIGVRRLAETASSTAAGRGSF